MIVPTGFKDSGGLFGVGVGEGDGDTEGDTEREGDSIVVVGTGVVKIWVDVSDELEMIEVEKSTTDVGIGDTKEVLRSANKEELEVNVVVGRGVKLVVLITGETVALSVGSNGVVDPGRGIHTNVPLPRSKQVSFVLHGSGSHGVRSASQNIPLKPGSQIQVKVLLPSSHRIEVWF